MLGATGAVPSLFVNLNSASSAKHATVVRNCCIGRAIIFRQNFFGQSERKKGERTKTAGKKSEKDFLFQVADGETVSSASLDDVKPSTATWEQRWKNKINNQEELFHIYSPADFGLFSSAFFRQSLNIRPDSAKPRLNAIGRTKNF